MAETPIIIKIMPNRTVRSRVAGPKNHRVVALAYNGLCTFEFGIVIELFGLPRPEFSSWYSFEVCGLERGPLNAVGGIRILPQQGLRGLRDADTIFVAGWRNPDEPPPPHLLRALRKAHGRGARLVSICSGIFVLAATGLLNGKRATTHWRYIEKLKSAYPTIKLEPDVLYVDEGDILTSAGSAAGIDLCLHIIRKDCGATIANAVARRLVVSPHREGGQAQFIEKPVGDASTPWLSYLLDWVQSNLHVVITVDDLAAQAHMSKRTLNRRFADVTGTSPLDWVTKQRIGFAKDLLETTQISVETVAERCGFGSTATLRHHFSRVVKLSPNTYRSRFQN